MSRLPTIPIDKHFLILAALVLIYALAGHVIADMKNLDFAPMLYGGAVVRVSVMLFALFLGFRVFRIMLRDRPRRLTRAIIDDIRDGWRIGARLRAGLPVVLLYIVFIGTFTGFKTMIPALQPYVWDEAFMKLDRLLHLGADPWLLLQPVLGYPLITFAVNLVYNLWFPVMFAFLYAWAFSLRDAAWRWRFLYSFILTWVVNGTVLAAAFSSAGPCFYERLLHQDVFAPLMDYLRGVSAVYPVWALATQDMLWENYQNATGGLGSGISAMPSVHVATAFLLALAGRAYGKFLRRALWLFFVLILAGSVHLGWHYAVDGYLAILVTGMIWWLMGRVIKSPPAPQAP